MPQSKGKKRIKLIDTFQSYPYKNQIQARLLKSQGAAYHIKKNEIVSDHEFSLTYEEYRDIINAYAETVWENLLEGKTVWLPYLFGYFKIVKKKSQVVDWLKTNELHGDENQRRREAGATKGKEFIYEYFDNSHTDGYIAKLVWMRKQRGLHNRYAYDFVLTRPKKKELQQLLTDDPSNIYKFTDL